MQFIKQHFFKLTTLAAVCLLIGAQGGSWVKAEENEKFNSNTNQIEQSDKNNPENFEIDSSFNTGLIPNMNCRSELLYHFPPSTIYNPSLDVFNTVKMHTSGSQPLISLQDLNGDGLPDYIYVDNLSSVGSSTFGSSHISCVYLNTGNGWAPVYRCYANTHINDQGHYTFKQYRGDCAG